MMDSIVFERVSRSKLSLDVFGFVGRIDHIDRWTRANERTDIQQGI